MNLYMYLSLQNFCLLCLRFQKWTHQVDCTLGSCLLVQCAGYLSDGVLGNEALMSSKASRAFGNRASPRSSPACWKGELKELPSRPLPCRRNATISCVDTMYRWRVSSTSS
jgi:hypothetical protein